MEKWPQWRTRTSRTEAQPSSPRGLPSIYCSEALANAPSFYAANSYNFISEYLMLLLKALFLKSFSFPIIIYFTKYINTCIYNYYKIHRPCCYGENLNVWSLEIKKKRKKKVEKSKGKIKQTRNYLSFFKSQAHDMSCLHSSNTNSVLPQQSKK